MLLNRPVPVDLVKIYEFADIFQVPIVPNCHIHDGGDYVVTHFLQKCVSCVIISKICLTYLDILQDMCLLDNLADSAKCGGNSRSSHSLNPKMLAIL